MKWILLLCLMFSTLAFSQDAPEVEATLFSLIIIALLAISEVLSFVPVVKANGIFQLAVNILKKLAGK